MTDSLSTKMILKHIDVLERELVSLKRDIFRSSMVGEQPKKPKTSLFGSVRGGDVTEEIIDESKRSLFRNLGDI